MQVAAMSGVLLSGEGVTSELHRYPPRVLRWERAGLSDRSGDWWQVAVSTYEAV
jgi:hypothetical protein